MTRIPNYGYSYLKGVIEYILFDLSGTLIDDLFAVYLALVDIFREYNMVPPTLQEFRREFRLPYESYLLKKGFKRSEVKVVVHKWKRRYLEYKGYIKLFSDVKPALKELRDFKIGVVSQTPSALVYDNLERFKIADLFDVVITDDDCEKQKPDPEGLNLAMERLGVENPNKAIYFGDMIGDLIAAWRAGVIPGGMYRENGSFHDLETLRQGNPILIIESLTELLPLVQRSQGLETSLVVRV